jgi:methyl-accepting chemotaxis protein
MAILAIVNLASLNSDITMMVKGPVASVRYAGSMATRVMELVKLEKDITLNTNAAEIGAYDKQLLATRQEVIDEQAKLAAVADPQTKAKLEAFNAVWRDWIPLQDEIRRLGTENTTKSNAQAATLSMTKSNAAVAQMKNSLSDINDITQQGLTKVDSDTNDQYASARNILIIAAILVMIISTATAVWIALTVSKGLGKINALAQAIAIGDLDQHVSVTSNDEINDVVKTVNVMTDNLRATALLADKIADGDLTVQPKPLSGKDLLGLALGRMTDNLRATAALADKVADGDLTVEPKPLSDKDVLGLALGRMT